MKKVINVDFFSQITPFEDLVINYYTLVLPAIQSVKLLQCSFTLFLKMPWNMVLPKSAEWENFHNF